MPVYQRGPNSFIVSVGSGRSRYREGFASMEEAEVAEAKEILRRKELKRAGTPIVEEAPKPVSDGKTLQDAYDHTWKLRWKDLPAAKILKVNAEQVLSALGRDTLLTEIDEETITEMVVEFIDKGNTGGTINKKLSCLSVMFDMAKGQKWITEVPNIDRRKEGKHRIRWMDPEEEGKALAICKHLGLDELHDFIIVGIDTGFRRGEMLAFDPKDFQNGLLHLHAGETKNEDARAVPATARVAEIIQRKDHYSKLFAGFTINRLRYQWAALARQMKMEDDPQFTPHMLRHTCASRLVQRGVPLVVVQKWLGHRTITTTLRYAHLAPDSLLEAKIALERIMSPTTATVA